MLDMVEHLKSRHMDVDLHKVYVNQDEQLAVFPYYNLAGQMTGFRQYKPFGSKVPGSGLDGKYYSFRNKEMIALFGMESWYFSNTLFLIEGVFDAAHGTKLGFSMLSVGCNALDPQLQAWVRGVQLYRPVVAVCDPGKAGLWLGKYVERSVVVDYDLENEVDLADAPEEYVLDLLRSYERK